MNGESLDEHLDRISRSIRKVKPYDLAVNNLTVGIEVAVGMDTFGESLLAATIDMDMVEDERLEIAIERAPEDPGYARLCAHVIGELSERGQPLPASLAALCKKLMLGEIQAKTPRGRPRSGPRDYAIATTVSVLLKHYPELKPTRNPTARAESACSIVADALQDEKLGEYRAVLSEKTIESMWAKYRDDIESVWADCRKGEAS